MGIELLTDKIVSEAREKAEEVLAQAHARTEEIRQSAAKTVAQLEASARESVEKETRAILERARSRVRLQRRNALLAARWRVIDRVLAAGREAVLSDPGYADTLANLVRRYRDHGWSVYISEQDERLYGKNLGTAGRAAISGGAVFKRERVEIDLSLDSVIAQIREELAGRLAQILFPEGSSGR